MTHPGGADWTADELARRALLEQGVAVAVNLRRHRNLIAWAKVRGLFVRVDRATPWGNPFELGKDGDRATVIAAYRDHYLPFKASLLVYRLSDSRNGGRASAPAPDVRPRPTAPLCRKGSLSGWAVHDPYAYARLPWSIRTPAGRATIFPF